MILNGAPIRFRTRSRIELTAKSRFLFGKQILTPADANTPARRIYFALQAAYVGDSSERPPALLLARSLIEDFKAATTSVLAHEILDRAFALAHEDSCYAALKLARRIIQHETAVLQMAGETLTSESDLPAAISNIELGATNGMSAE